MTIIKNGCDECGGDWYTTTEQCNTYECRGKRKTTLSQKINHKGFIYMGDVKNWIRDLKQSLNDCNDLERMRSHKTIFKIIDEKAGEHLI